MGARRRRRARPPRPARHRASQGKDPIFDALDHARLPRVHGAPSERGERFDEFDLDDTSRPRIPFPTPEEGVGVDRYDMRPPRLPKASDACGGGSSRYRAIGHFRKVAIYVKDGIVIRVLEDIDVVSRLDEIQGNYDIEFPPDVTAGGGGRRLDRRDQRRAAGSGRLRRYESRVMSITYRDEDGSVELPSKDVVPGDLSILESRGVDGGGDGEEEEVGDAPKTAGETSGGGQTDAPGRTRADDPVTDAWLSGASTRRRTVTSVTSSTRSPLRTRVSSSLSARISSLNTGSPARPGGSGSSPALTRLMAMSNTATSGDRSAPR